jgi:hypothetical protein
MLSPRTGSPRRSDRRRWSLLTAAAVLGLLPATGCQVEYAGMTLPSGKYMHDDVQYFAPGTDFPYANTQAATQRARMSAMGMAPTPGGYPGVANPNAVGNQMPAPAPVPPAPGPGGAPGAGPIPPNPAAVQGAVPNPNPVPVAPGATSPPGTVPSPK